MQTWGTNIQRGLMAGSLLLWFFFFFLKDQHFLICIAFHNNISLNIFRVSFLSAHRSIIIIVLLLFSPTVDILFFSPVSDPNTCWMCSSSFSFQTKPLYPFLKAINQCILSERLSFFPFSPLTSSPSYLSLPPPSHFISISSPFPPPLPFSGQLSLCLLYSPPRFVTDLSCQPCDWPLGSAEGDEAILISSGLAAKLVVFSTRTVAAEWGHSDTSTSVLSGT